MEEYISRNKLIKFIRENKHRLGITVANSCNFREIANMIDAEDVAPVVHAKFLYEPGGVVCSECGKKPMIQGDEDGYFLFNPKYCPHCGARMDG